MNDNESTDDLDSTDDESTDDLDSTDDESTDDLDSTDDSDGDTLSTMSEGFGSIKLKYSLRDKNTQITLGVAVVLVAVFIVVLVRACGSGGDSVERLLSVAEDVGETLENHADEVGDDDLYRAADRIIDAERELRRNSDIDYDDIDDLEDLGNDAAYFAESVYRYMVEAADIVTWAAYSDPDTSELALKAARKAGDYLTNDTALSLGRSLSERMLETELSERARRDDDESAEEYREAAHALLDATEAAILTEIDYWINRAELSIDISLEDDRDTRERAEESLEDSYDRKEESDEEFDKAVDDFVYYRERVGWRDQEYFEPRLPWR